MRAATFGTILALLNSIFSFFIYDHPNYFLFSFFVAVLYALCIYVYPKVSRLQSGIYLTAVCILWLSAAMILYGGNFASTAGFAATFYISYVLISKNKRLRNIALTLNILFLTGCTIFLIFNEPIYPFDNPIDQIFMYIGSLFWIIGMAKVQENEKNILLESVNKQNVQLTKTKEELERFTYIASHDLKSPLRTVISFLGLIERDLTMIERTDLLENLNYAQTGAKQMSNLVNDILEWSTVNASQSTQENEVQDFKSLISISLENIKKEIEDKKARIIISDMVYYRCNKNEFIAVFQNLIQNGIKYNESESPTVTVWSERTQDKYIIHVKDNGIGIDGAYSEQIFEYFKRLHTSKDYQGTGLGLGLCKKIIEKYDGTISVDSNAPDQGSTFTIVLPNQEKSLTQSSSTAIYPIKNSLTR